jgi:hypothetical protein
MSSKYKVMMAVITVFLIAPIISVTHADTSLQLQTVAVPQPVSPGNEVYMQITITNSGLSSVDSIKIKNLDVDPNIVQVTQLYDYDLGGIAPSKSVSMLVKFRVPAQTPSGFYPVTFSIEACRADICDSYIATGLITVQSPSMLEIASISPTSLVPGEINTLDFKVSNLGDSDVSNVQFSWTDSSGKILPIGADNKKFIQSITRRSDQTIETGVIVSPDAQPGVYPITISVDYIDQIGTQQHLVSTAGLRIVGNYDFVVSLETQDVVATGMSGTAEVKISNAGTQDAQFLTVKVLNSDPLQQIIPTVIYVGNLKSNDYDTEKFQFHATNAAPGVYPLKIELVYKDPYGQSYDETQTVNVRIYSKSEVQTASNLPTILLVVIVLVIILVVWNTIRRRRKKKKSRG